YEGRELLVVGHTDAVGSDDYNQALSERRAQAAADFLVTQGVSRTAIRTVGRGETEPIASNDTPEGRQMNRRVEVAIFASEEYRERVRREVQ
ncbi:MAG TPA: OmpA family protein, partial [Longimicrobiales bacterium]|nr:OmpA family protein [Longimicrobiales bacterium]